MSELDPAMVTAWLDAYKEAWERQDGERIVDLFTETAQYVETPFDPAMVGREAIARYWHEGAVSAQRDISFDSTLWAIAGNVAFAHWKAEFTRVPTGEHRRLDGVFCLTFEATADGLPRCERLEEWWHADET
ncbi:MAG: nuclear transport factor 2 family protein [Alphaproteobacteria bacterium]|nr:nuclear transport factor 2 family protein [Alphaproteobacteria bacterium]